MNTPKQPPAPKPIPMTPDQARRALGWGFQSKTNPTR
jgi:hypothetical protein